MIPVSVIHGSFGAPPCPRSAPVKVGYPVIAVISAGVAHLAARHRWALKAQENHPVADATHLVPVGDKVGHPPFNNVSISNWRVIDRCPTLVYPFNKIRVF